MKMFLVFLLGLLIGIVAAGVGVALSAPKMMTQTHASPVGVEETVQRLTKAAEAANWKVLGIRKLHESIKEHTGKVVAPVHLVDLCEPHHASRILEGDETRSVSVFMPCTVSVYETSDGKTYVTTTNAELLGTLFGGVVREVMAGPVAEAQERFVVEATAGS